MHSTSLQRILIQALVMTQGGLKARYRNSLAGYLWVILSPLALFFIQAYVFRVVFKIQVENYLLFLLMGLVPWLFFSQTLEMVTTIFQHQNHLIKSLAVNPFALILSTAFSNMINSLSTILIVLMGLSFYSGVPWEKIYLFPLPFLVVVIISSALGFVLAIVNTFFYDTKFVLSFVLGILFFASPVLYPEHYVPEDFQFMLAYNPLVYILRPFRSLSEHGVSAIFWMDQLVALGTAGLVVGFSFILWRRVQNAFFFRL